MEKRYLSIGMLSTISKLLERLLSDRIRVEVEEKGGNTGSGNISPPQMLSLR